MLVSDHTVRNLPNVTVTAVGFFIGLSAGLFIGLATGFLILTLQSHEVLKCVF